MGTVRVGVDVGGTFTGLVALVEGRVVTAKVPSTPEQSEGVLAALETSDVDPAAIAALAHGTTVATNALLERKAARVALVTTAGSRDGGVEATVTDANLFLGYMAPDASLGGAIALDPELAQRALEKLGHRLDLDARPMLRWASGASPTPR